MDKTEAGLKTILLTRNTVMGADGKVHKEERYFISSLPVEIEEAARAVRGHWIVESYHWHLDVTFREDENRTIDKIAAQNLNIIRKWSLSILKMTDVSRNKRLPMKKKRYVIGLRPIKHLEEVLNV